MNRVLWLACMGLAAASSLSAQEPKAAVAPGGVDFPKVELRLDQLVPKDWKAAGIETNCWPYGDARSARNVEGTGLAITLQGPMIVQGPKGEPALECLTVWIMPEGYHPSADPWPGALTPATLLGPIGRRYFGPPDKWASGLIERGKRYLIYVKAWTEVKSWPTWEKEIRDYFVIQPPNGAGQFQMPPPPEPNVPPLPGPAQRTR